MPKTGDAAGLKLTLLMIGVVFAGAVVAFLSLILAVALSAGQGPGAASDRMLLVLGLLALAFLAFLPPVHLLARRWSGRAGLAWLMTLVAGLVLAPVWVITLFMMAVVLNR
jgi:hypothetical protein